MVLRALTSALARKRVHGFVLAVACSGAAVLATEWKHLSASPPGSWALVLAILTVVSGRFVIKVPGQPASVTVSEVFVFASMLLFGPALATFTVALDGLWTSVTQKQRRWYRAVFNVAEPALSTFVAGTVFFLVAGVAPFHDHPPVGAPLTLAVVLMSATYFVFNSLLQAGAVALENGISVLQVWRQHALYLSLNYYAAASLATLAVKNASGVDLDIVGLVAPVLILSYVAYKAAADRIDDAQRHVRDVEHLYQTTVEMLAIAVDARDRVTHSHIRRVQRHTIAVARALGVDDDKELKALEAASLLHDIGKLAVPDYVLNKPGALSPSEFETMKKHAAAGATILGAVEFPYPVVPIVRHHHEQWSGTGYPDGLVGEAIPLGARILTVIDCFDALTSDRPYRRKLSDGEALEILRSRSGTMYDPRVVELFINLVPALRRDDVVAEAHFTERTVINTVWRGTIDVLTAALGSALVAAQQLDEVEALMRERLRDFPTGAAEGCFFVAQQNEDVLSVARATTRLRDEAGTLRIQIGEGVAGWVASNRYTIINSNADLDLGHAAERLNLGACTAAPVFASGKLVGVVSVYLSKPSRFSDEEVTAVGLLAQDIGDVLVQHVSRRIASRSAIVDSVGALAKN